MTRPSSVEMEGGVLHSQHHWEEAEEEEEEEWGWVICLQVIKSSTNALVLSKIHHLSLLISSLILMIDSRLLDGTSLLMHSTGLRHLSQ